MSKHSLWITAALITAAYFVLAGTSSLWGTDEPRFSSAAFNMVRSGNYLYATFNGAVRAFKPILIYWMMAVPLHVLGLTVFACRFWSPLATGVACLCTGLIGRRLFDERTGLMAMIAVGLNPLMIQCGAAATVDAVLLALVAASMWLFVQALERGPSLGHWVSLLLLTAAAMLLKGPAALLVPVFIIPTVWWLARGATPLRGSYLAGIGIVLVLSAALFLVWGLPANRATAGIVFRQGIGEHVVGRAMHPMEGHGSYPITMLPYYLLALVVTFFPWTLYLPGAISATLGGRLGGPLVRPLLIGWTVPVLGLLTLVATKLPHYALPVYPALALAVAATARAASAGTLGPRDLTWLRRGVWFMLPVGVPLGCAIIVWPWTMPAYGMRLPAGLVGVLFVATTLLAARAHLRRDYARSFATLGAGMALSLVLMGTVLAPALEPYKIAPALARALDRQAVPPGLPLATVGQRRSDLVFALDRGNIEMLKGGEVGEWLQRPEPGLLLIDDGFYRFLDAQLGLSRLRVVTQVEGIDFARAGWVVFRALERPGRPPVAPPARSR